LRQRTILAQLWLLLSVMNVIEYFSLPEYTDHLSPAMLCQYIDRSIDRLTELNVLIFWNTVAVGQIDRTCWISKQKTHLAQMLLSSAGSETTNQSAKPSASLMNGSDLPVRSHNVNHKVNHYFVYLNDSIIKLKMPTARLKDFRKYE